MTMKRFVPLAVATMMATGTLVSTVEAAEVKSVNAGAVSTFVALKSHSQAMQVHMLAQLKQPVILVDELPKFADVQTNNHQLAKQWLDTLYPQLVQRAAYIESLNNKWSGYLPVFDRLTADIQTNNKSRESFLRGLSQIEQMIVDMEDRDVATTIQLKQFAMSTQQNRTTLTTQIEQAMKLYADKDGKVAKLTDKIASLNNDINSEMNKLIISSVTLGVGAVVIVVGGIVFATIGPDKGIPIIIGGVTAVAGSAAAVGVAATTISDKRAQLQAIAGQLSEAEAKVATLKVVKTQIDHVAATNSETEKLISAVSEEWKSLKIDVADVKQYVENSAIDPFVLRQKMARLTQQYARLAQEAKEFTNPTVEVKKQ